MHIADRDDGSHCRVQDPNKYREKEADVADLSSSTDSEDGVAGGAGGRASIRAAPPRRAAQMPVSRET